MLELLKYLKTDDEHFDAIELLLFIQTKTFK